MTLISRLHFDSRQEAALDHLGQHVRVVTEQHGNRTDFTGWVTSVPNMRSGTTGHVVVIRQDPARPAKDVSISLAQVISIEEVPR